MASDYDACGPVPFEAPHGVKPGLQAQCEVTLNATVPVFGTHRRPTKRNDKAIAQVHFAEPFDDSLCQRARMTSSAPKSHVGLRIHTLPACGHVPASGVQAREARCPRVN